MASRLRMNILLLKSGNTSAQRIIRRSFFGSREYKPETSKERRKKYKEKVILVFDMKTGYAFD